jgi:two-component system OmpR family response regulator
VLALTARDEVSERVHLLNLGADDYLSKPFALAELEARIGAVTRRAIGHSGGEVRVGQLRFDLSERQVYVADQLLALSPREFGVLEILMLKRGRVVSKSRILEHLCNWDEDLTEAAVELYVHRVRKKIKGMGVTLRTLRGLGYMLQQSDATDNVADDSDELELVSDDSVAANSLSGSGL